MRLGIRAKQIAGVTLTVGLFVVVLSAVYVSQMAEAVLGENEQTANLLAKQIFHRAFEIVPGAEDPYQVLREDPGLRSLLESSLYGEVITGAAIVNTDLIVVTSDDRSQIDQPYVERDELKTLVDADVLTQLQTIFQLDGPTYEVREDITLNDDAFGSIRVKVNTVFVKGQISGLLRTAVLTGALALAVAVVVAGLLAQLLLKPIHVIRSGLTRLGKGEFGVTLDLPPGDEFGELGSFFNTVSQQLSADRSLLAGQKANLQSAVEHLEDAVALFDPSGQLLFSNPAMQPTLPAEAIGRALRGLLPDGHPYRALVEETLAMRVSRGPVQVRNPQVEEHRVASEDELLVMTHAVSGTDGGLVGVLLVARNIAHLSRMQSTLAYSRKLVALGRLTAGIAHEVKNPLNAMMIHLELLRTKIRNVVIPSEASHATMATAGTLALSRPSPSPFVQGTDTGFQSARLNSVFAFPLSGRAPFTLTWKEFGIYFEKMRRTGVVDSMKDFYWDIRPKPEFGTIEVRVMDTPLTVERAAAIAAYLQCVARWLVKERPFEPQEDDYLAYTYNRFQACRFGLDGEVVDSISAVHRPLRELIAETIDAVEMHAIELHAERGLVLLKQALAQECGTDAAWLRAAQSREQYLPEVVRQQCLRFEGG